MTDRINALRDAVRRTRQERPFFIDAWVVLPDHLHAVWTLPPNDFDYSTRWSVIKARFSREVAPGRKRASHVLRREKAIWQRRFWEHHVRNRADYADAVEYCVMNPVKHALVSDPLDWEFSSIHRDVRAGRWTA